MNCKVEGFCTNVYGSLFSVVHPIHKQNGRSQAAILVGDLNMSALFTNTVRMKQEWKVVSDVIFHGTRDLF